MYLNKKVAKKKSILFMVQFNFLNKALFEVCYDSMWSWSTQVNEQHLTGFERRGLSFLSHILIHTTWNPQSTGFVYNYVIILYSGLRATATMSFYPQKINGALTSSADHHAIILSDYHSRGLCIQRVIGSFQNCPGLVISEPMQFLRKLGTVHY